MRIPSLLAALALPLPLAAHPHVFADSRVELVMDGALVTGVRLTWTYDEFFSLLLTEDLGLDADADAVLTEEELAVLRASVSDWPPDFSGDLVVTHGEEPVELAARSEHSVDFVAGQVVESHLRPLAAPVSAAEALVTIENYDPYYYVAYEVLPEIGLEGAGDCEAALIPADPAAGQAEVDRIYGELDVAGAGVDVQLPPVGFAFTDRVELRCAA